MASPTKEKQPKPKVPSRSKPGAPTKRTAATRKDSERNLRRVLSNERVRRSVSRGPIDAFALMRSASTTVMPGLKREASDPLMSAIPKEKGLVEKSASALSRSASFTTTGDLKAKKKAELDEELKNAISALKKPNRALLGRETMDTVEKRQVAGISQLKSKCFVSAVTSLLFVY
jgi:DNA replication regulator SLD3